MQYFLLLFFLVTSFSLTLTASPSVPTGWASVNANGQNGTTGGLGGDTVWVSSLTDLVFQSQRTEPLTILIEGMIDLSTLTVTGRYVFVHSHKSIIGAQPGSGIINGGFRIRVPHRNIIFRNLNITNSPEDGIQLNGEINHIWIDRCTFSGSTDGAVDVSNGANYITISNSLFTGLNRASLISSSDDDPFTDRYKVTFHHNWFRGTTQRHPRVRFGQVHVFNNYYSNIGMYGIGIGDRAQIISENNFFEGVVTPSRFYDDPVNLGFFIDTGSILLNSGSFATRPSGINWRPSDHYAYTLDSALHVRQSVMANSGAEPLPTQAPVIDAPALRIHVSVFPNPMTEFATIQIYLPEASRIRLVLLDITGRKIYTVADQFENAGYLRIPMERGGLQSGLYLLRLEAGNAIKTIRLLIQ